MIRERRTPFSLRAALRAPVLYIGLGAALAGCATFARRDLPESPADARISAEVRTLLEQSPALEAPNLVSVQTLGGVIYLRGLVSTPYQIGEAGSLAARVPGALHVENLLSVDNAR